MADYTRDELMQALRAADTVGDTQAATAIARRLSSMQETPKGGPNFGNVQSRVLTSPRSVTQLTGVSDRRLSPTTGMSTTQRVLSGIGKSMADTGRGIKQAGTQGAMLGIGLQAALLNRLGLPGNEVVREYGLPLQESLAQQQQAEMDRRVTDSPLLQTPAGMAGNVGGTAVQFLGPGAALRGSKVAPLLMPRTVGGNAAQGALLGLLQPATSGEGRVANAGVGAGAGMLGALAPAAVGSVVRKVRGPNISRTQKRAGRAIIDALQGRPFAPSRSAVPGVTLPLGEATLDPGLIRLEDSLRTNPETSAMFSPLDLNNNSARVEQLRKIAGGPGEMAAAAQARSAAADPLYAAASVQSANIDPQMQATLNRLPPSVMNTARRLAVMDGSTIPKEAQEMTGQQLHYVKLALDNALSKTGPGSMGNVERRLLMQAKDDLTTGISAAIPAYGQAMDQYAALSKPINRMQFGEELLQRGRAAQDDALGNPLLQPGRFGRAMQNIDDVAQSATGFDRATARGLLSPEQFSMLGAINDDLRRQSVRATTPGGGSRTASRLLSDQGLSGRLGLNSLTDYLSKSVPVLGGAVDWWRERTTRDALESLGKLFTSDPQEAGLVLAALSPQQRSNVEQALIALGGRTGVVAPALLE